MMKYPAEFIKRMEAEGKAIIEKGYKEYRAMIERMYQEKKDDTNSTSDET